MRGVHSAVDDIRRNVFKEVALLAYEDGDLSRLNEIPYKMIPGEIALHRVDVFLERAILKERLRLALGLNMQDPEEHQPLSATVREMTEVSDAASKKHFEKPLVNIIPFACNKCPPKQIRITDSCQGCLSHPCMNVCPKNAIYLDEQKHCHIDQSKCVKCGRCFNQCPYTAISRIERPCAAACGMDAIGSDELGRAKIDYNKCVNCGMCLVNCPFGAIADKSQIFQTVRAIQRGEEVIAIVAPAFVGQFGKAATPGKIRAAMRQAGFSEVVEVAIGADLCTVEEAHAFLEEVPEKMPWMGTSCCPAWSMMCKKLFPKESKNVSMALTPMVITARMVKLLYQDCKVVFVGPCAAKKAEANRRTIRSDVDFVLTFEEMQGIFDAKGIDFNKIEEDPEEKLENGAAFGRGFAVSGGVAAAVAETISHLAPDRKVQIESANSLRDCRKMLALAKAGKRDGYLLEGMACPGGCVAGAGTIAPVKDGAANVEKFKNAAALKSCLESPYLTSLNDVEKAYLVTPVDGDATAYPVTNLSPETLKGDIS